MARFLTPRWLFRHALVLTLVGTFLALGWWQVNRARGGNTLSFAYAIEWPVFAAFVVFVWVKEIRRELSRARGEPERQTDASDAPAVPPDLAARAGYVPFAAVAPASSPPPDDNDPELVAYNRYLEWLAANPGRRPREYPG